MTAKVMFDTNLWVYLYAGNSHEKQSLIRTLLTNNFDAIVLSTQILGELYHVLTRKKLTSGTDARDTILEMVSTFPVLAVDSAKVILALDVQNRYGYTYWDSLILATALMHDCQILYTEDMQNQQVVENNVQIINPFTYADSHRD